MESSEHTESSKNPSKATPNESDVTFTAQSLKNLSLNTNRHCLQCARKFDDDTSYTSHYKTDEHATMVLVTGIDYFEGDPQDPSRFPLLFYCVLCNVYSLDYKSYEGHLKGIIHKEMAQFMRCISFWKEKILVGMKCKNKEPSTAQDFEDLKKPSHNYCQLCDKQCNSVKTLENHSKGQIHKKLELMVKSCEFCNLSFVSFNYYERHLKSDLHTRIKDFMMKMLIPQKEITETAKKSDASQYKGANKLPQLYFCKLCWIEFNDVESFRNHKKISIHRRIRSLINKISIKQDNAAKHNEETGNQIVPRTHYCEVCNVWCLSSYQTYDDHAKTARHQYIQSNEAVKKWDCSPEYHPPGFKPWR